MDEFEALLQSAVQNLRDQIRSANGGSIADSVKARGILVCQHACASPSLGRRTSWRQAEPAFADILQAFYHAVDWTVRLRCFCLAARIT